MKLFVYGTLLSSQPRYRLLKNIKAKFIGCDDILAKMYTINREWPFILLPSQQLPTDEKNPTVVTGEIYELSDKDINRIDDIEGYNPERNDNLFNRLTTTTLNNREVFIYIGGKYLKDRLLANAAIRIEYGDWIAYRRMLIGYSKNTQQKHILSSRSEVRSEVQTSKKLHEMIIE